MYKMSIDLNVLDHLGINLYSNVAAVLTEVVANAWDADADLVKIEFKKNGSSIEKITIRDDGHGMNVDDVNDKFLRVGYQRRVAESVVTSKGRHVMGRKGLGKLALLSIAESARIVSIKNGKKIGLTLDRERIKESAVSNSEYHPEPMRESELNDFSFEKGTLILLEGLRSSIRGGAVSGLKQRLARRFSVLGSGEFVVEVDGEAVTPQDRGDSRFVQFLWTFGEEQKSVPGASPVRQSFLPARFEGWNDDWIITGWIGTATKPKQLDTADGGNLNSIVLHAHGRLFHENVLSYINDGRLYTKYLTGQLEADFLDSDDGDDIATSDRQRVREDDERFVALLAFLRQRLNDIESQWNSWRKEVSAKSAVDSNPALKDWLDSLGGEHRKNAEQLIGTIAKLKMDDEEEVDRKELYKNAILAFERIRLTGGGGELLAALESGPDEMLRLLGDIDALEASLYADIVRVRLSVVEKFEEHVDDNALEKVLQVYLFEHLWLLDPSWDRVDGTEIIEKPIVKEFERISADVTGEERRGRVDIKYRNTAGKHLIIELKRAGRVLTVRDLIDQGLKYVSALKKCLADTGRDNEPYEVIFVLGSPPDAQGMGNEFTKSQLDSINGRYVTYAQLIHRARNSYREYLEKNGKIDKIKSLVDRL